MLGKEVKILQQLKNVQQLQNLNGLTQEFQRISSRTHALDVNQQARNQDFLALYNQTIINQNKLKSLRQQHEADKNENMRILQNIKTDQNRFRAILYEKIDTIDENVNKTYAEFIEKANEKVTISASSLGSVSESLSTCSKFHFEEKVLEKVVRLEHKLEVCTEKMKVWEESISSSLVKVTEAKKLTETFVESMRNAHLQDQMRFNNSLLEAKKQTETFVESMRNSHIQDQMWFNDSFLEAKKQTETFVESMRNSHIQDQMRFNDSFLEAKKQTKTFVESMRNSHIQDQMQFNDSLIEAVDHFRTQSENETWIYGRQMNSLFDSLSSKIQDLEVAESKRESIMESSILQHQSRFNESFDKIFEHFQVRFNNSLQEIEIKQKKVGFTSCASSAQGYSLGSIIKFPDVLSKIGISNISTFKSSGKFTCKAEGLYQISVTILSHTGDKRFGIYMNKHLVSKAYISSSSNYESGTAVAVAVLKRNDELSVKPVEGSIFVNDYASCITIVKL
ncbi:uncharacterized protein LOC134717690 [Mytilus trossulus]|uniref:uncharacterized protein LOC134717690 n=1 Tax=Mytilus trossulus TaxID=6551 RepID=UPI0030047C75